MQQLFISDKDFMKAVNDLQSGGQCALDNGGYHIKRIKSDGGKRYDGALW